MIPDKHPKEEFVVFGVRWTPGARRIAVYVILATCGGLLLGWDKVAQILSSAPVWAFLAFIAMTCFSPVPAFAANVVYSPEAVRAYALSTHYEQNRGFSQ